MNKMQIELSERNNLIRKFVELTHFYTSSVRRANIAQWANILANPNVTYDSQKKCLKYYKRLQKEAIERGENEDLIVLLNDIVEILDKFKVKFS